MTLHVQFMSLVMMALGGFYLGMALDTFRRFSWHWKRKVFLRYFLEILFWLSQSLVLFYLLFRVNNGELRLYIFLSCLMGFAAYQALAATIYKQILEVIIRLLRSIYHFLKHLVEVLIIVPIKWLVIIISAIVLWMIRLILTVLIWVLSVLFYPLGLIVKLIYQKLPKRIQGFLYKYAGFYSTMKNIYIKWLPYITFKRR